MELGTGSKQTGQTLRIGVRKAGRRPSRFAPLFAVLARLLPSMRRRARIQGRLEQIQTLRHFDRVGEDAP